MRRVTLSLTCLSLLLLGVGSPVLGSPSGDTSATTCAVSGVYERIDAPPGTLAVTILGSSAEEVSELYVPAKLNATRYEVSVTRKGANLYKVDGKDLFIRTRYCYEYAYSQEAMLDVRGKELVFR